MIAALNRLVSRIEEHLTDELDVGACAADLGTTEYHLRRMFSSLAGFPLSEYVRRRRMTLAAGDVVSGTGDFLTVAVRYGYTSSEAFGRAFRSVHGIVPGEARRHGGPLRSQPRIAFQLTVKGSLNMDVRVLDHPSFRLIGHAARVPLIHSGVNPRIAEHVGSIPPHEHLRLKALSSTEPAGLLAVSDDLDPDRAEETELTYLHGVAVPDGTDLPDDLDTIDVAAGGWAVFRSEGPYPATLQRTWAATATEWFPSNRWRLRPGPEIVAILDRSDDFSTATSELWLPVEPE